MVRYLRQISVNDSNRTHAQDSGYLNELWENVIVTWFHAIFPCFKIKLQVCVMKLLIAG